LGLDEITFYGSPLSSALRDSRRFDARHMRADRVPNARFDERRQFGVVFRRGFRHASGSEPFYERPDARSQPR
jgi:hypothetical protein